MTRRIGVRHSPSTAWNPSSTSSGLNANCEEPTNFAFLQRNGVPAGPPSPQLADVSTFTPNAQTLLMNQGDSLALSLRDTPQGLLVVATDLTTHQTGYMVASGKNGFMNTNHETCDGTPFNFHPEYNTAKQQNQVPWAALEGGVLMEQEIGHFEPCSSITNSYPYTASYSDGQSFSDPDTAQTCVGGFEGRGKVGEGPCNADARASARTRPPKAAEPARATTSPLETCASTRI